MSEESIVEGLIQCLGDSGRAMASSEFTRSVEGASLPGMYSWWADEVARAVIAESLGFECPELIYVGQAGATSSLQRKLSAATLGSRVMSNHLRGNIRGSTFRYSVAATTHTALSLEGTGSKRVTRESEERLSAWMHDHLAVVICPVQDRSVLAKVEPAVIRRLDPPLNLNYVSRSTPWRTQLQALRRTLGG